MKTLRTRSFWLSLGLIFLFTHCGGETPTGPSENPGIVAVTVNPPSATLKVGTTVQLTVSATLDGVPTTQAISFISSDPSVVAVTTGGLLSALKIGSATITATASPSLKTASAVVTVIAGDPSAITKSAGDGQSAFVGDPVPTAPSITLRDAAGNPTPGINVTFTPSAGSGTVTGATATTNSNGVASVGSWTLGSSGTNTLAVTVSGFATLSASFTATGNIRPPALIIINGGDSQTANAGAAVAVAPSVRVTTATGAASPNVPVTFSIGSGGGSITGASQTTNSLGIATVGSWTLGTAGSNTLVATAQGVGSVTINATATAVGTMALSASTMSFATVVGGGLAGTNTINVTAVNATPVPGLAVGPITYSAGASGWLTATLAGTTTPTTLSVQANGTGITTVGSYTATVPITSTTATNSPQTLTVTFNILPPQTLAFTTQPGNANSGQVFPQQPVVKVVNSAGQTLTGVSGTVTATLASGTGQLSGTTTVNLVNGVATFTDLKVVGNGAVTLSFTSSVAQAVTSQSITITPLAATQMAVTTQPGTATSNVTFPTAPVVTLRDVNNNQVFGNSSPVTVSLDASSTGTGTLSGTLTTNAINGVATFSNLKISAGGTYVLKFSVGGAITDVTSNSFTVNTNPAASIAVSTQPGGAVTGSALAPQPVVQVRDNTGGIVANSATPITATLNGAGGTLSGTTTVNATNGVATFTNLVVTGAGSYTLTFAGGGFTATSNAFTITALPASQLFISTQPGGAVSGVVMTTQPVVQIRDNANGVVATDSRQVTATIGGGSAGTLSGTTTVTAVNGVATFTDLKITGTGNSTITFTSTPALTTVTSNTVNVVPGSLHHFLVEAAGGGAIGAQVAGTPFNVQITAQDASNNTVTGFTGTATITSNRTGTAGLTTTASFTNGVLASHSITLSQVGAGATITATNGAATGTSAAFTVNAGALHHFLVEASAGGAIPAQAVGAPFTVKITAQDAANNTVTSFTGTADITSNRTGSSGLGTTAAFTAGVLASHSITLTESGASSTITATRTGGTETGTSAAFTVNAGALHHFLVEAAAGGAIGTQTAGVPFSVKITAQDAGNNTVVSFNSTANVTSNRAGGGLATTAAFTNGVLASHSVTLTQSGALSTITATRTGGTETGVSNTFTVNEGALHHFLVESAAGGAIGAQTAGTQFAIKVTAQDANNNTVTGFTGTADITSNRTASSGLSTTSNFVAGVLASHNVTLIQSGASSTITATQTGGGVSGTSAAFAVNAGALHHFAVTNTGGGTINSQVVATPFSVMITARDANENTVTGFTGTVAVSSNVAGSAGLTTSAAFTAGVLANHSITLTQANINATITATRTGGTETGTSNGFAVDAGAVDHFLVEAQGGGAIGSQVAGAPFNIRITAQDASNNTVTTFTGTVGITSNRAGSAGLTTTAGFTNGVLASHSVTLTQSGAGATLTATRTGNVQTGTSNSFTVNAGTLDHFKVEAAAGGAIGTQAAGTPFSVKITAQDVSNNTVTSFTGTADVSSNRTGSAGLTTSAAFSAGVLASHSITLTQPGLSSTITATRTGGTETGTSNTFTVDAGAVHHFLVEALGGGPIPTTGAGTSLGIRITAQDAANNTVIGFNGTVDVTSNRTASVGISTSGAFTNGVGTHLMTITQAGAGATVTATRTGGTETGTSNTFTVTEGALHHFAVEAAAGGAIGTQNSNVPFAIKITAQDNFNNTVTAYNGTVGLTSTRGGIAGVGTTAAFTNGVLASHTVNLVQAGSATLTATRTGGTEAGSSNAFTVNPGVLDHFHIEATGGGAIPSQTANVPFTIRIETRDAYGNLVPSFTGTVDVSSNFTGSAGLTTTASFAGGILASHSVTLTQAGTGATLSVTQTGGTKVGTTNAFNVSSGPPHHFLVEAAAGGSIGTQVAGVPFAIKVTAQDAGNNTVTGFNGSVDITSNRTGSAGLTTTATFTNGVLASHNVTLSTAGAGATITATRTGGTENGTSNAFTVNAGALDHFLVEASGGGAIGAQTAGTPFSVRITAQDAGNNTVTGFTGTVDVSSNRTGTSGLTTTAAFSAGVLASHSITLTRSGTASQIFALQTGGAAAGSSTQFTVNAGAVANFEVEGPVGGPIATQVAGVPFNVLLIARDQFNNFNLTFNGTVSITSNRTLSAGSGTTASFVNGQLTHSVTISGPAGAGATLTATRTGGTETGTSNAFTVNVGAVHHFLVEAAAGGNIGSQVAGTPFNVKITAQDAGNNTVTGFTGTVDVTSSLAGTSGLTTTASFTSGVLASHSVNLSATGTATITATRTGGTEAGTSNSFAVTGPPTISINTGSTATATGTQATDMIIPIIADMSNAGGQNVASLTMTITWDPAKWDYVEFNGASVGSGSSFTGNDANSQTTGQLVVSAFSTGGFTTSRTMLNVTLRPKATATGTQVTTRVTTAGDSGGNGIPPSKFVYRDLSVTTP